MKLMHKCCIVTAIFLGFGLACAAQTIGTPPPKIIPTFSDAEMRGIKSDTTSVPRQPKCFVLDIETKNGEPITQEMVQEALKLNKFKEVDCASLKKKE
jgi:hypothetical protein